MKEEQAMRRKEQALRKKEPDLLVQSLQDKYDLEEQEREKDLLGKPLPDRGTAKNEDSEDEVTTDEEESGDEPWVPSEIDSD